MDLLRGNEKGNYIASYISKTKNIYVIGAETYSYFNISVDKNNTEICYAGDTEAMVNTEKYYEEGMI